MSVIKLKRGNQANVPALVLQAGEPAFALDTGKLYIGNGTDKVLINPDQANAETATKLQTARSITLTGDATGSVSFDGSANVTITTTVADNSHNHTIANVTGLQTALDGKASSSHTHTLASITDAGTAAFKNTGTTSGTVPLIGADGKLDAAIMPAIAITDTFVVATQTAMLALNVQVGDIAVRTDLNKSFILKTAGASTLANWQELLTPTDTVTSVAGKTGAVTLAKSDVGLGNADNTSDAAKPVSTAMQTALNAKANLASPALTGTPTAPTAAASTNTTQIATTAFVKAQGYLDSNSTIDGGTF